MLAYSLGISSTYKLIFFFLFLFFGSILKTFSQAYFQQEVNFKLDVTLNDKTHELYAFERIEYINNSPDTLKQIYFHLWPNAYSNNSTPLANELLNYYGKEKLFNDFELIGYIDSLDFEIEEKKLQWELISKHPDICIVLLDQPILPNDTVIISTPFRLKIPKGVTSRLGHIGESYQISQWYPKPAVYDNKGWHYMSYQDQAEFYSEFGQFVVNITLPDNYIVGATGNLETETEIARLNILASDTSWLDNLNENSFPESSKKMKTLCYKADNVHDFAWFADKRFHVMKSKVELKNSSKEISTWVMFTNEQANLWIKAIEYVDSAIISLSEWIGDYPYDNFTAVQSALTAGIGMEYPGITVIGDREDAYSLEEVITHEICHSWFYGALGSNERDYPFMDEGIASLYEMRYLHKSHPRKRLWEVYIKKRKFAKFLNLYKLPIGRMQEFKWLTIARENNEYPLNLNATFYNSYEYNTLIYTKVPLGFRYLKSYLGDSIFDSSMQEYYSTWKFKHPGPKDLQNVFELITGKNLTWFFEDFLGTTKHIDYEISRIEESRVLLKNKGQLESPVLIAGITKDSIFFKNWIEGFNGQKWIEIPEMDYEEIKIDPEFEMPDLYRLNNNIRKNGILKKADPIQTQLYFSVAETDRIAFNYVPTVNWTKEDGFMIGMLAHNGIIIPKKFQYFIMPFYTLDDKRFAGYGRLAYNILPYEKLIRKITISAEGSRFGAPNSSVYSKSKIGLDLSLRNLRIGKDFKQIAGGSFIIATNFGEIWNQENKMNSYYQLHYGFINDRLINPNNLSVTYELNKDYQKATLLYNYKLSYNGKNRGLEARIFAGGMIKDNSQFSYYRISPSGRSGRELYLFEGTYPDRFSIFPTTFWSKQMTISEGSLISPINEELGFSKWLVSFSMASNLPFLSSKIPVKVFANILLNDQKITGTSSNLFCETGFKVGIWNLFEIYVPVVVSKNLSSVSGPFKENIRFVFDLNSFSKIMKDAGIGIKI